MSATLGGRSSRCFFWVLLKASVTLESFFQKFTFETKFSRVIGPLSKLYKFSKVTFTK